MSKLSAINISIQQHLFPALEEEIGELSATEQKHAKITKDALQEKLNLL